MLIPFLLPFGVAAPSVLGLVVPLRSALPGRARAHSPGLIYFFKGSSFILVGLGGKEGRGFCKVSTACPVNFPQLFFFLPLSLLPSFFSKPASPHPRLAVSLPRPPSHFFFCVSGFSLSSLWVSRVRGRRGEGGRAPSEGGGGAAGDPAGAPAPPTGGRCLPGAAQGRGLGPGKPVLLCAAGRRALLGELLEEQGGGGWGEGKGKCRYILKTNNLDTASSSLGHPVGASSRGEGARHCPRTTGVTSLPTGSLLPQFFLFVNVSESWKTPQPRKCVGKENKNFPNPTVLCSLFRVGAVGPVVLALGP